MVAAAAGAVTNGSSGGADWIGSDTPLLRSLDDVKPEIGLDDSRNVARPERECRVGERRHHLPLGELAEIAAPGTRAGIVGVLLGERGEVAALLRLLERLFCALFRLRLGACHVRPRAAGVFLADPHVPPPPPPPPPSCPST